MCLLSSFSNLEIGMPAAIEIKNLRDKWGLGKDLRRSGMIWGLTQKIMVSLYLWLAQARDAKNT